MNSGDTAFMLVSAALVMLLTQAIAVGVTLIYSFVLSYILFWVLDKTMRLRVSTDEEVAGLDTTQHQEAGYSL